MMITRKQYSAALRKLDAAADMVKGHAQQLEGGEVVPETIDALVEAARDILDATIVFSKV